MLYYPTQKHSTLLPAATATMAALQTVGTTYCTIARRQNLVKASNKVSNIGKNGLKVNAKLATGAPGVYVAPVTGVALQFTFKPECTIRRTEKFIKTKT